MRDNRVTTNSLSLREIAAWQLPILAKGMKNDRPQIIAAIPSLQRGAIWKPNQVELLWDSVLRGFPIGALVISHVLAGQRSHAGKHGEGWPPKEVDHHLLDGQQRCNALALGFQDPFETTDSDPHSVLWLDLSPESQFATNSSRTFLVRLCTIAHPWGYGTQDSLEKVSAEQVRQALKIDYGCKLQPQDENYKRPRPKSTWPCKSNVPVPLSWLLHNAECSDLRNRLTERIEQQFSPADLHQQHWARKAYEFLSGPVSNHMQEVADGLRAATSLRVTTLTVAPEALARATRQELSYQGDREPGEQRIANVEHLFQRLNAGGTELRGDELLYSMIKAYWPGIEDTIDHLQRRPPATQVALLGTRVALTDMAQSRPRGPLTISQLRMIASPSGSLPEGHVSEDAQAVQRQADEQKVKMMFALREGSDAKGAEITKILSRVDEWLLYDPLSNRNGMPPVLRSRMAEQHPEIFYFIMILARVSLQESGPLHQEKAFRRRLLGLATAIHWFGVDVSSAMHRLWEMKPLEKWLTPHAFRGVLGSLKKLSDGRNGIVDLRSPRGLAKLIDVPTEASLQQWHWWDTLIVSPSSGDEGKQAERQERYWPLLQKLPYCEPLLLYCQREWMARRFGDYDRYADNGYWHEHNRPWDLDHILPQKVFSDVRKAKYLQVCQQWGNTIGNLHVLRFEENRSRQDRSAVDSISDEVARIAWLRHGDKDLRSAFSISRADVRGATPEQGIKVLNFVCAARTRLLRLYAAWYKQLDIRYMLER